MANDGPAGDFSKIANRRKSHEQFLTIIQGALLVLVVGYAILLQWVIEELFMLLFILPVIALLGATISAQIHLSRVSQEQFQLVKSLVEKE